MKNDENKATVSSSTAMICSACLELHTLENVCNMRRWLENLDVCKFQRRGQCPNLCADGQHLWSRAHGVVAAGN